MPASVFAHNCCKRRLYPWFATNAASAHDLLQMQAEAERTVKAAKSNPFGDAKPREAVLSQRTGKTEEEISKAEVRGVLMCSDPM